MRPGSLVVTGASAGIGRALAELYAAPGARLVLVGRDPGRLGAVAAACEARGADVVAVALDVRDRDTLGRRLRELDEAVPVELVVANAGVALPEDDADATHAVIDVNLGGALNTVLPLLPAMTARRSGQIALIGSLAALAPLADAPAYSASKAALLAYGLALRERLAPAGVRVSVACPGFVATGMGSRYRGARPFEIGAEAAAARIAAGLARNRDVIAFPLPLVLAARASALLPERLRRIGTAGFRFTIDRAGPDQA